MAYNAIEYVTSYCMLLMYFFSKLSRDVLYLFRSMWSRFIAALILPELVKLWLFSSLACYTRLCEYVLFLSFPCLGFPVNLKNGKLNILIS